MGSMPDRATQGLLVSHRLKTIDNPRYTNQAFLSMFNTHQLVYGRQAGYMLPDALPALNQETSCAS
jgi:hypothetical protein